LHIAPRSWIKGHLPAGTARAAFATQGTSVKPTDIARVQAYLRKLFGNADIHIDVPKKPGASVEVRIGDEFIGTLHRDDEEGEVSFAFQMVILDEDLPPPPRGR
jgi:hypothetical protein